MAYSGKDVVEHMVPLLDLAAESRIRGFYEEIGWSVLAEGLMLSAVPPCREEQPVDGIGYWRTDKSYRLDWFEEHSGPNEDSPLSGYTFGLRLPRLMDLIERPLELPSDEAVFAVIDRGGHLLEKHTHIPSRRHAGRWEFRFADPFLYGVRVVGPKTEYPKAHIV